MAKNQWVTSGFLMQLKGVITPSRETGRGPFSFRFFVRIVVSPRSPPFCKPKQVYHTDTGSMRSHLFLRVCSENVVVGA